MSFIHRYIGFVIPAGFALLFLWALVALIRNKAPGERFWTLVGILQAVLGIQVLVGAILFVFSQRPPGGWLHYAYGGLFPAALLVAAHQLGRRYEDVPWIPFGVAALLCAGLTARALMTGLGIGVD